MKPTRKELLVGIVMFIVMMFLSSTLISCSSVDTTSCKYKVAQQKKAIKAKQAVKTVSYYARAHKRAR